MAPVPPIKRRNAAKKSSSRKEAAASKSTALDDVFRTSKRDKRVIKHASFISKIEKSSTKTSKRRRTSKKLATSLESLVDVLPEATERTEEPASQPNIIKQKTLRHKPGALKRKQQIEKIERNRFAKNMAQLSGANSACGIGSESGTEQASISSRWAALRNFVSQTMEQQPVFRANK